MLPHLQRSVDQFGAYTFTTPAGEQLLIVRAWALTGRLPRECWPQPFPAGRWFVVDAGCTRLLGNGDGYRTLRQVREHIAAVEADRAKGFDVSWGAA